MPNFERGFYPGNDTAEKKFDREEINSGLSEYHDGILPGSRLVEDAVANLEYKITAQEDAIRKDEALPQYLKREDTIVYGLARHRVYQELKRLIDDLPSGEAKDTASEMLFVKERQLSEYLSTWARPATLNHPVHSAEPYRAQIERQDGYSVGDPGAYRQEKTIDRLQLLTEAGLEGLL